MNGLDLLDATIHEHKPIAVLSLFSGGDDSLTATHIASRHYAFTSAVYINTGTAIQETTNFVRSTSTKYCWRLREKSAGEAGQSYEQLVCEYGFPGPAHHYKMYNRLKERALRVLIREVKQDWVTSLPWWYQVNSTAAYLKRRAKVLLVTGVRSQESERRMGYVEPVQIFGSWIWCAVIHDWSKRQCLDYIEANHIERNPVSQLIHRSGECNCGSFAKPDEAKEVRFWYPQFGIWLDGLTERVRAAGHDWGWGERPPKKLSVIEKRRMQMCQGCIAREV